MKQLRNPYKYQGGWVAFAVAAVGTVMQYASGRASSKDMKRARALQRAQVRLQNAITRRDTLRQVNQATGSTIAGGYSDEGVTGSGTEGAITSSQAQTTEMLRNTEELNRLGMAANRYEDMAAQHQSTAMMWGAIGSIASSAAGSKAIDDAFSNMFNT